MEQIHGIDVSWMSHGSQKERGVKIASRPTPSPQVKQQSSEPSTGRRIASPTPSTPSAQTNGKHDATTTTAPAQPRPIPAARPARSPSIDKVGTSPAGSSPSRRGSWFSNISSKFSSSAEKASPIPQSIPPPREVDEIPVPKLNPARNAVLQHAVKHDGDAPYTPAPPKSGQAGILQVLRRLSSSAGAPAANLKGHHGLVERCTLNVDQHRDRCLLKELNQAKLKRVAFCVDVEIAPLPKYTEGEAVATEPSLAPVDKTQMRKMGEKGEGEALKKPKEVEAQKEQNGTIKATGERVQKEPEKEGTDQLAAPKPAEAKDDTLSEKDTDMKKKEKKKRSEEERKARKEKKRRLAEANGTIPMEIHPDEESSGTGTGTSTPVIGPVTPRVQVVPTTNPVRVYRRCCQLRETPILKRITEQLAKSTSTTSPGYVEKLDLTGFWLQLQDLVTLGDYLAVVPIKEVVLENCGLNDESLRVLLAGMLAAKVPYTKRGRHAAAQRFSSKGGAVERLVLKNNKFGPEGWRHICLFVYLCRSLKYLDLSYLPFPKPVGNNHSATDGSLNTSDISALLAQSIGQRIGGSTLELLNLGSTGLQSEQLRALIDGVIKCKLGRLGLAHNNLDDAGVEQVARYLRSGKCEGLDLGGNDLRDRLEILAGALTEESPLWALSLAEANLKPVSLCKLFPKLIKLKNFRFLDLSHNRDLFDSEPSSISTLRRYLPQMVCLKRLHLADVAMKSAQAIALAEVLPEVHELAHVSLLENPELSKLADARTEDAQEEACAFYASLLASVRYSPTIVCIDLDVPTEESSEIVKALGKSVVAYCLRNMESVGAAALAQAAASTAKILYAEYPDVLQHLIGRDVLGPDEQDEDVETDNDYVIGGTGVVKALATCLDNSGAEFRGQPDESLPEADASSEDAKLHPGKARDMSKHLLLSAKKIRKRLQPALLKAKVSASQDASNYQRLLYLDNTLDRVIKRFEDEFPDSRESLDSGISVSMSTTVPLERTSTSVSSNEGEGEGDADPFAVASDDEDTGIRTPQLSRSNSVISSSSKALAEEEARVLRAGHRFRAGWANQHQLDLLAGVEEVGNDPQHVRVLHELMTELQDPELDRKVEEKGIVRVFKEDLGEVLQALKNSDPEHWERFIESQKLARANVKIDVIKGDADAKTRPALHPPLVLPEGLKDEARAAGDAGDVAVADD